MRITFLILFAALFLTGCVSSLDRLGYTPKSNLEREIATLRANNVEAIKVKEAELKVALGEVIAGKDAQISRASDSLYGATLVRPYFKEETRPLLIVYARIEEAKAALGVGPTLKGMQEEQARLFKELDETLTTLDQLRVTSEAKIKENEQLVSATQAFERKVAQLEEEKIKIEREGLEKLIVKQDELNAANNVIIAKEKENAESRKYIEANKLRISIASGLLAVACVAGAFFSPIFKDKLALGAGLFGAISVGILFIEPWHVACAFGLIFLVALTWFLRKHFISHKTNENLINAIQSIKDKGGNIYETHIKPELSEWNTKYLKSGDKIEDKTVTGHIDEILKDYERK
jgi:membrane protein implicated in regulation of membrane protease activity